METRSFLEKLRQAARGTGLRYPRLGSVIGRLARALIPNLGTLLILGLIYASSVGAGPFRNSSTTATTYIPRLINYQGRLLDAAGDVVANDTYQMTFALYCHPDEGDAFWTEPREGPNEVPVSDGLFSVALGSVVTLPATFPCEDDVYLGIKVEDDPEMRPRELLTSVPYALLSGLPSGVIVMWSGPVSAIPAGWSLCDGTNGTPDLRDRFVLSVSAGEDPGGTGGSHTKTLSVSNLPPHTHSFTTGSAGAHSHGTGVKDENEYRKDGDGGVDNTGSRGLETTTDGAHTHSGTTNSTGSGASFDIRPKYYKLAFIMKD